MLQPFCHKDFGIRSLGDRIKDLGQCVYLYPDIPKDKAFGNYYTPLGGKTSQPGFSFFFNELECFALRFDEYFILSNFQLNRLQTDM